MMSLAAMFALHQIFVTEKFEKKVKIPVFVFKNNSQRQHINGHNGNAVTPFVCGPRGERQKKLGWQMENFGKLLSIYGTSGTRSLAINSFPNWSA